MATYDYRCPDCNHEFEANRPMRATNDECCPKCGAAAVKVFAPVSVAFKGTGFHNTDYREKPKDPSEAAAKPEPACPAKNDSAGCASCPAASTSE